MVDVGRPKPPFDRRLALVLGTFVVGPVLALVAWTLANADRLPDRVATHWGPGGQADGFSSLSTTLAIVAGVTLAVSLPMAVIALVARETMLRRTMAALAAGMPVFLVVMIADSLRTQLGLTDPSNAPSPDVGVAVGALLGIAVGVVAGKAVRPLPRETRLAAGPPAASLPRLDDDTAASVDRRLPGSRGLAIVLVSSVALTGGLALVAGWGLLVIAAALAVMLAIQVRLRVTVTPDDGLRVHGLGIRLLHVPPDEIAMADVGTVDPWQFGGWGLRIDVHGRTGVVTRKGPALEITRGDGSEVIISLDDPEEVAAALNSAADRVHRV